MTLGDSDKKVALDHSEITLHSNVWVSTLLPTRRFRPLWNYTTLKLSDSNLASIVCFRPLWNYTTLKRQHRRSPARQRFRPLWNYTTLKRSRRSILFLWCFRPLWNYTTLKQPRRLLRRRNAALDHSEITLHSNGSVALCSNLTSL